MKIYLYLPMLIYMQSTLTSCHSRPKDAPAVADSLNKVKEKTSDVRKTGGIDVNKDDAMFTTAVYDDEMAEIMMGKLAKSKSTYISIKDFAGMIASDCIKVNQELAGIARKKNITLPAQPDSVMLKKIAHLKQQEDIAFDQAYVNAMIDSHKKKLSLMNKESRRGADPDLRAFAGKITPTIKKHLQAIEKVRDQIK